MRFARVATWTTLPADDHAEHAAEYAREIRGQARHQARKQDDPGGALSVRLRETELRAGGARFDHSLVPEEHRRLLDQLFHPQPAPRLRAAPPPRVRPGPELPVRQQPS